MPKKKKAKAKRTSGGGKAEKGEGMMKTV